MSDLQKLIPKFKEWQNYITEDSTVENWIANEGNISLAIGYSFIFWPDFIEHENCIFLKSHFSLEGYNSWKNVDYAETYSQIEFAINHIHILDLFLTAKKHEISKDQVIYLGNTLRDIYEIKLKAEFGDRQFVVTFNAAEDITDLIDYQLSFHLASNEIRKTKQ